MKLKKNKVLIRWKKRILTGLLIFIFSFSSFSTPRADAFWGEFVQVQYDKAIDQITKIINGIKMGMAKQQAVTTLSGQISSLIGGGGGGSARFITNWKDYLVSQPENIAQNYMNDYLSQVTRGRGSISGYISEGFSGSGNYSAQLSQIGKNVINQNKNIPQITYEGDPAQMFDSGNFKNFGLYLSGVNSPWAFQAHMESTYQQELEDFKRQAEIKAIANQGFIGTGEKDGQGSITYPGSLIKETVASVQDLPNKIIAGAQNIPEIITAAVSQMISQAFQQGFSQVQRNVQQTENNVQNSVNSEIDSAMNQSGPGAMFDTNMPNIKLGL